MHCLHSYTICLKTLIISIGKPSFAVVTCNVIVIWYQPDDIGMGHLIRGVSPTNWPWCYKGYPSTSSSISSLVIDTYLVIRTQGYLVMPVSGLATSHVIKRWLQSFHVLALICSSFVCNDSWHTCVCSAHLSKCTILTWFHHFSAWKCTWHLFVRTLWYHSLRHQTGN